MGTHRARPGARPAADLLRQEGRRAVPTRTPRAGFVVGGLLACGVAIGTGVALEAAAPRGDGPADPGGPVALPGPSTTSASTAPPAVPPAATPAPESPEPVPVPLDPGPAASPADPVPPPARVEVVSTHPPAVEPSAPHSPVPPVPEPPHPGPVTDEHAPVRAAPLPHVHLEPEPARVEPPLLVPDHLGPLEPPLLVPDHLGPVETPHEEQAAPVPAGRDVAVEPPTAETEPSAPAPSFRPRPYVQTEEAAPDRPDHGPADDCEAVDPDGPGPHDPPDVERAGGLAAPVDEATDVHTDDHGDGTDDDERADQRDDHGDSDGHRNDTDTDTDTDDQRTEAESQDADEDQDQDQDADGHAAHDRDPLDDDQDLRDDEDRDEDRDDQDDQDDDRDRGERTSEDARHAAG